MPSFQIFTNVAKADLPENIIEELTENIAEILGGVPKKVFIIVVRFAIYRWIYILSVINN